MSETSPISTTVCSNKKALVIGINDYETRNNLTNSENDARDTACALREINFNVEECLKATYDEMNSSLNTFIDRIEVNDMVLFYFAGHGQQWEDQNYLIPSNDDYIEGETIKYHAFNVQEILNRIGQKQPFVIIVLLDCCRDYHLRHRDLRNVGRGLANTDVETPKGFKKIYVLSPAMNCLIAFACAPGRTASDFSSNGHNGVFTWHLLQHIKKPNKDIRSVLTDVAIGVYNETKIDEIPQEPWINCSLKVHDIFLNSTSHSHLEMLVLQSPDSGIATSSISNEPNQNRFTYPSDQIPEISIETERNDTFISQYANDYHTIKALGKGSFGCVFEVVYKLNNQRLAVKRISFKTNRQLNAAIKETQALARLTHPHIIRYFHTWLETPPADWQKAQDNTYDWRDVSRNDTIKTMTSEANSSYISSMLSSKAGATAYNETDSNEESYDIDYFLKKPTNQTDISQTGNAPEDVHSPTNVGTELVNILAETTISDINDQQVISEVSPVEIKFESLKKKQEIAYLYYSMELCSEDTLERRLSPSTFTKEETCHILRQIIETIGYLHEKKMIHGDIKPANIFFSSDNSIKIGDFGLAVELLDSTQAVIEGRKAPGTYWYKAPELRAKQDIQYDEKVDIYAMGIVFLELLAPFKTGADRSAILDKIRRYTKKKKDITPILNSYEKAIDYNLLYEPIILKLLNPLASERPSAKELLDDKTFLRLISGIRIENQMPSVRWIQEISLPSSEIAHGYLACSQHEILLYENKTFIVFNAAGQKLTELEWTKYDYDNFGFISSISWSNYLRTFLVLSHCGLFKLKYSNFQISRQRLGAIYAQDNERESRLRFITCDSQHDHLFLNRGYHTIQRYKMSIWRKNCEWNKNTLNYSNADEIHEITADRNGKYLVMNVCKNGSLWMIDIRAIDSQLTRINHLEHFYHKLQLLSSSNHWLFAQEDPNRLYLYDIEGNKDEIPKEMSFGNNEHDPHFSFSKTAPIHFRWLGNTHLVLGTTIDGNDAGLLKLYRV